MGIDRFSKVFFILMLAVSFAVCASNICDDEDSSVNLACPFETIYPFNQMDFYSLFGKGRPLSYVSDFTLPESIISYLASHEKSPPV